MIKALLLFMKRSQSNSVGRKEVVLREVSDGKEIRDAKSELRHANRIRVCQVVLASMALVTLPNGFRDFYCSKK